MGIMIYVIMVKLKYGDKVRFRWNLGYGGPGLMMVLKESREFGKIINNEAKENERDNRKLLGMRCTWFNKLGQIEEGTFSTKDLIKVTGGDLAKFELNDFDKLTNKKFTK